MGAVAPFFEVSLSGTQVNQVPNFGHAHSCNKGGLCTTVPNPSQAVSPTALGHKVPKSIIK